jgi:hypothetical protein
MEYVQGKTLRQIMNEGPVPIRKIIGIAAQVAEFGESA